MWAIYFTARTHPQWQNCSSAVPQGTGCSETRISADALSCSWQAASSQCWGQSWASRGCRGDGCDVCAPLPSWDKPPEEQQTLHMLRKAQHQDFIKHIKWFCTQAKCLARRYQVTRNCSQYCLFSSLAIRKPKFFLITRSKIPGTSIYIYSYHGQEKKVLRSVVSTILEFLPIHQRHTSKTL